MSAILIELPAFTSQAACAGQPVLFTTDRPNRAQLARARQVCAACPVLIDCAKYAHRTKPIAGIWAGKVWDGGDLDG